VAPQNRRLAQVVSTGIVFAVRGFVESLIRRVSHFELQMTDRAGKIWRTTRFFVSPTCGSAPIGTIANLKAVQGEPNDVFEQFFFPPCNPSSTQHAAAPENRTFPFLK
jgi:hypothetical protein